MAPNGKAATPASGRNSPRNPTWSRDETILLLDLYKRFPRAGATHPEVILLSEELNRLARRSGAEPLPNFRNSAGVAMRLRNLARHDPETDQDRGLKPGGAMDIAVWNELSANPDQLGREVDRIRRSFVGPHFGKPPAAPRKRLPADMFAAVTAAHLRDAAIKLADGFDDHPFHESTSYDVLFEGRRLSPKALFGLAAEAALGRTVGPRDFSVDVDTPCFRIIAAAGYPIVARGQEAEADDELSADDRRWAEGGRILTTHLRRERATGLASAKRAQFRSLHGKLLCERCGLDPVAHFGADAGEACIEVHHCVTAVAEMETGHHTSLDDLQCLCANCHRVVHRLLKLAVSA